MIEEKEEGLDLLGGKFPELRKMSKEDMKKELELWRNVWGYINPNARYYIARTTQLCRVITSYNKEYVGLLLEVEWDIKNLDVGVYMKTYNYGDGKYYWERKIVRIDGSKIMNIEWISEQKEVEAEET